jgi:hypothetical protein
MREPVGAATWLRQIDARAASAQEVMQWGADPLWDTMVPVTAAMLHSAAASAPPPARPPLDGPGETRSAQEALIATMHVVGGGRAISRVRLLGDVIALKVREKFIDFTVDDGTGLLPCVLWQEDLACMGSAAQSLQLGRLMHVGGYIRRYLGRLQLNVWFLALESDADAMSHFWLQVPTRPSPRAGSRLPDGCPAIAAG